MNYVFVIERQASVARRLSARSLRTDLFTEDHAHEIEVDDCHRSGSDEYCHHGVRRWRRPAHAGPSQCRLRVRTTPPCRKTAHRAPCSRLTRCRRVSTTARCRSCAPRRRRGGSHSRTRGRVTLSQARPTPSGRRVADGWGLVASFRPALIICLTPGQAHCTPDRGGRAASVDNEVMALWLARDRLADGRLQCCIISTAAQHGAQICRRRPGPGT